MKLFERFEASNLIGVHKLPFCWFLVPLIYYHIFFSTNEMILIFLCSFCSFEIISRCLSAEMILGAYGVSLALPSSSCSIQSSSRPLLTDIAFKVFCASQIQNLYKISAHSEAINGGEKIPNKIQ